jgi:two-component system response regulator DevR
VSAPIRVFLLDDHEIVRAGVRDMLESAGGFEVVAEAGTAAEAMAWIRGSQPDVAVLDVRLGDGNGIEVCRDIRSDFPDIACVMLTSFSDDEAMLDSLMAGAAGYVLKQIRGMELVEGLRRVAAGESLHDPEVQQRMVDQAKRRVEEYERVGELTPQEMRIFELIGQGLTNRQIAEAMFLAEKTVKNYVSNLLAKLGMSRRTEVAARAARRDERHRQRRSGE